MDGRIRVAIMGAPEVVAAGLRAVLAGEPDIEVLDSTPAFGTMPDVIVYDVMAIEADDGVELFTAIKEQDSDSARSIDPSQPLMVLPFMLPEHAPTDIRTSDGERVKLMAPKIEPQDPTMIEMMQRYPDHYVNGALMSRKIKDPQTKKERDVTDRSFLIQIPVAHQAVATHGDPMKGGQTDSSPQRPGVAPLVGRPQQPPAGGKLKSIGD